MTKYIIEYVAGTKGDMLVRFLNNIPSAMIDEDNNRTLPTVINVPNWLKIQHPNGQTIERYREVLEKNNNKFISAHVQHHIGNDVNFDNLLKELDYKVIKILFNQKYYKTILIESLVKNFGSFDPNEDDYPVKMENFYFLNNKKHITSHLNINDFKYFDYKDNNLLKLFNYLINNIDNSSVLKRYDYFNNNNLNDKILFDYEKLFVTKDLDYDVFQGYDFNLFNSLVDLSFPKNTIEMYGVQYDLTKYGYKGDLL